MGLLYPEDVSKSPYFEQASSWVLVEDVQETDPLFGRYEHAAWIDPAAVQRLDAAAFWSVADDVRSHPLVEEALHDDADVVYVRAPALVHEDVRLLTAAAIAERIAEGDAAPGFAGIATETPRRTRMSVAIVAIAALLGSAFVAGSWWSNRRAETPAAGSMSALTELEAPAESQTPTANDDASDANDPIAPAPSDATGTPLDNPPIGGIPVNESVLLTGVVDMLKVAGYMGISAAYDEGTVILEGVMPAADLGAGYFARVDAITQVVASIDGVESVVSRLYLRGDDAALRAELNAISEVQPIEFPLGSADLTDASLAGLERVAGAILANPGLRVFVAGHTDASGDPASNAELGAARAAAVIRQLVTLGVPITRLQPVAYGELFPEGESDAADRRVEFEVAP